VTTGTKRRAGRRRSQAQPSEAKRASQIPRAAAAPQCPPLRRRRIPKPNPTRPTAVRQRQAGPRDRPTDWHRQRPRAKPPRRPFFLLSVVLPRPGQLQRAVRRGRGSVGEDARCRGSSRPRRRCLRRPRRRRRSTTTTSTTASRRRAACSATPSRAPPLVSLPPKLSRRFGPVVSPAWDSERVCQVSDLGVVARRRGGRDVCMPARCHQDQVPGARLSQDCHRRNWG
jgi:hypothetical protein